MDSSTFTVLIAVGGLGAGFVLGWLLMGRSSAAAPVRPEAQAELTQAKERIRQLEQERQAAVKNYEDLKHQSARARPAPDASPTENPLLAERAAQLSALQTQLVAVQAQEKAARADAAQARAEAQAEQAQAKDYFRSLEKAQQLTAAEHQALKLQAAQTDEALAQATQDRTALQQENAALKRSASAAPAAPAAPSAPRATPAQATQLPALEAQVMALQTLEKAIQKEFKLLAELQRNVTLTSATVQEFHDSPESREKSAA